MEIKAGTESVVRAVENCYFLFGIVLEFRDRGIETLCSRLIDGVLRSFLSMAMTVMPCAGLVM
jgi:hypothetical protein